jgi:hypothetical protein
VIFARALPFAIALTACSPTAGEEVRSEGCVDNVNDLFAERAAFVEARLPELKEQAASNPAMQALIEQRAKPAKADGDPNYAVAADQLREAYKSMSLKDIGPWQEFMAELDARENRIRLAIRECPEAAKMMEDNVQEGGPQVQMND